MTRKWSKYMGILMAFILAFTAVNISKAQNGYDNFVPLTEKGADNEPSGVTLTRYTVLALDYSDSMSGVPLTKLKEAACKFINDVLNASGNNYVAIVVYGTNAVISSEFRELDSKRQLQDIVNKQQTMGSTNTGMALRLSGELLSAAPSSTAVVKNIVLMSDGLPNTGPDPRNEANLLKNSVYFIYSLGFFHSLSGANLTSASSFMQDVQNAGYYEVNDPNDLLFTFGQIAGSITQVTGKYTYGSPINDANGVSRDYQDTYYYDDGYFTNDSANYNPSLATMSLCFELSAWGSNAEGRNAVGIGKDDYSNKSVNAQKLLNQTGFTGIAVNEWFTEKPGTDTIGVIGASKDITDNGKKYTLIAVAVRGGGYESEWSSNFKMGETGQHEGFREAKENVIAFLNNYISYYKISGDIKLWLTGYSRAGGTVSLVAGMLDDGYALSGCNLASKDLFAYTFEAPQGGLLSTNPHRSNYKNIWNNINLADLVPKVAPIEFGFARYGNDRYLPTQLTYADYKPYLQTMLTYFNNLDATANTAYILNDFTRYQVNWFNIVFGGNPIDKQVIDEKNPSPQSEFCNNFIKIIAEQVFVSRTEYTQNEQTGICQATGALLGNPVYAGYLMDQLKLHIKDILWNATRLDNVKSIIRTCVIDASKQYPGVSISDKAIDEIVDTIVKVLHTMLTPDNVDELVTLIMNGKCFAQVHYPEVCLSWLKTQDPNFNSNSTGSGYRPAPPLSRTDGDYRVIHINCPVDVEVYRDNKWEAGITSGSALAAEPGGIIADVNKDGEKLVYLPPDAAYTIKITATGDDNMTYAVQERSFGFQGVSRIVNYSQVPIHTGDVFTAIVPAFGSSDYEFAQEGSAVDYKFYDPNGNEIAPANDLKGEAAANAKYSVSVQSNNENGGVISGNGERYLGEFAQVSAYPYGDSVFEGWYDNGELISTSPVYRFPANSDIILTAKFSGGGSAPLDDLTDVTSPAGLSVTTPPALSITGFPKARPAGAGGATNSGLTNDSVITTGDSAKIITNAISSHTLPLIDLRDKSGVYMNGKDLLSLASNNSGVIVRQGRISITIPPALLKEWNLKDSSEAYISVAQLGGLSKPLSEKLVGINEINALLQREFSNIGITIDNKPVTTMIHPFMASLDITNLNAAQKTKLTGVLADMNKPAYKQLGGELAKDGAALEFYSCQTGLLGAIATDKLTKMWFQIGNFTYFKDGTAINNDVAPYISPDNRTMLPLRVVAESLNAKVEWDEAVKTVTIQKDGKTLRLVINKPLPDNLGLAVINNNRTFVPIRYVAEQLNAYVVWDEGSQKVYIYQ